jgi:hypothetical protein
MAMRAIAAAALILASAPALGQEAQVQVGTAKWDKLPSLKTRPGNIPYERLANGLEEILKSGQCAMPGQTARFFDVTVPFAVLVEPNGKASRILVADMKCRPLEEMIGSLTQRRAERGDFVATGQSKPRWYASKVSIAVE